MPRPATSETETQALTPEQLQKVIATIDIPVCPAVVAEALAESQRDDPSLKNLTKLISADPSMAAAALKLANSALYRSGNTISAVRPAVDRLGTKNVVCIVVAVALRASVDGLPAAWLDRFWRRINRAALVAALVARRQIGISSDAAYTYTLFHDAAIPMLVKRYKDYEQVMTAARARGTPLVEAESGYFPCSHPVIGSLMVRNWGLPPILGQAIRFHHEPDVYDISDQALPGAALSLIAVTQVAEYLLAELLGDDDLEGPPPLYERAMDFLGISDHDLDDLREQATAALREA